MLYPGIARIKVETIHGYKVITGGNYLTFNIYFSSGDEVLKDYSLGELRDHTITEQAFTLYELYGRYYETTVPVTVIENYLSELKKTNPEGRLS